MLLLLSLFIVCESECESKWWKKTRVRVRVCFVCTSFYYGCLKSSPSQYKRYTSRNATPHHSTTVNRQQGPLTYMEPNRSSERRDKRNKMQKYRTATWWVIYFLIIYLLWNAGSMKLNQSNCQETATCNRPVVALKSDLMSRAGCS